MTLIHRYWQGPQVDDIDATARAVLERHPGAELTDWTPAMLPTWIARFIDRTKRMVVDADQARHAANVARLCLLDSYGGHWLDNDVTLLGSLTELPRPATAAHRSGHRCNCWLSFDAHDPALALALDDIACAAPTSPVRSMLLSGEAMLERIWRDDNIARVKVRVDVDGKVTADAPVVLQHAGRSANKALTCPPQAHGEGVASRRMAEPEQKDSREPTEEELVKGLADGDDVQRKYGGRAAPDQKPPAK